jgi:hypothetical protein
VNHVEGDTNDEVSLMRLDLDERGHYGVQRKVVGNGVWGGKDKAHGKYGSHISPPTSEHVSPFLMMR